MSRRRLAIDLILLLLAAVLALAARAWLVAIYVIPSASMMPTLLAGDYLLVERWRFAVRHALPARGEIIVFHGSREDYAKRVVGLPGDRIALSGGRVAIDDTQIPRWRIGDLVLPVRPNTPCLAGREAGGCRYHRYRELLPGDRLVDTIDLGAQASDDMAEITVPSGQLFVLGDNRDRSADSRFAVPAGTGLVPVSAVIGTPRTILFSVDGSARLARPRGWWPAVRADRVGIGF